MFCDLNLPIVIDIINLSMVMKYKKHCFIHMQTRKGAHQPVHPLSLVSSILLTALIILLYRPFKRKKIAMAGRFLEQCNYSFKKHFLLLHIV